MTDLKDGLYVREKEISLKEFHTIPGSYTIKGSYKKILSVFLHLQLMEPAERKCSNILKV